MVLSGEMEVRPPTDEEIARALNEQPRSDNSPFLDAFEDEFDSGNEEEDEEDIEFTLRRAAEASREGDGASGEDGGDLRFGTMGVLPMSIQQQAHDRHARMKRFEGRFVMEIPGDAFERANQLRQSHPPDPSTGRIPLEVPLSGTLFELTIDQAEDIYLRGKRDD
jgi:hypothetical protein